jgi:hypothetical protein
MAMPPAAMAVSIRILAAKRVPGLTVLALTPVMIAGPVGRIRLRRDFASGAVMAAPGRRGFSVAVPGQAGEPVQVVAQLRNPE